MLQKSRSIINPCHFYWVSCDRTQGFRATAHQTLQTRTDMEVPAMACEYPHNPLGTDGFEFVGHAAPDLEPLRTLFSQLGFTRESLHRNRDITLHRQGDANFIINAEPGSFAGALSTAATWTSGRAFKRASSISGKSPISISKAK
ncbi:MULTISPECIES: hypothetical protein [Microbulbifer]|uniref:hypothetical protein n=1 Tax=Microbulbifer TaxID=48073 RepID=UPI001E5CA0BB|nr:hypothetical protein [Microbulbifer sp. YPW16]UHQ55472.1 hypothetical protein LVE68_00345 [Microbulbifer sp. YPW16]